MGRLAVAVRRRCRRIATDRPATDVTVVVRGVIPSSFRSTAPAHTGGTGALFSELSRPGDRGSGLGSTVWVRSFGRPENHDASRPIPSNAARSGDPHAVVPMDAGDTIRPTSVAQGCAHENGPHRR